MIVSRSSDLRDVRPGVMLRTFAGLERVVSVFDTICRGIDGKDCLSRMAVTEHETREYWLRSVVDIPLPEDNIY